MSNSCDPMDCSLPGSSVHGVLQARILEGVAMPSSRGSSQPGIKPSLPHCRWILYHLSHQGSPWILVWAAYPFSRLSSWSRNWSGVSCTAGGFLLPTELPGKAQLLPLLQELFFFFSFCGQEEGKILVWGLLWHQRFIAVDLMGSVGFRQVSRTEASLQHQQYS